MRKLPEGWCEISLAQSVEIVRGITFSKSERCDEPTEGYVPCLRTSNIQQEIEVDDLAYIPINLVKKSDRFVRSGDVIISMSNSAELVGKVAKARYDHSGFAFGAFLSVLRSTKFDTDFLFYLFRSADVQKQLRATASQTVNIANLSLAGMGKILLPMPPLNEQRRIVAKLDSLFAHSKAAHADLARVPRLIERTKQTVLDRAFSGELTWEWRDLHTEGSKPAFDESGIDGRVADIGKIPDNWSWTSIGQIAGVGGGLTKNTKRNDIVTRVPYLRVANVYANELRLGDVAQIGCTESEFTKTRLQIGDLLIVEGNGSIEQIGRVAIWNDEIENCSHQNHLIRVRPISSIIPKYVLFWLLSPQGRGVIERVASSSAGLHTLSISKVEGLPIPVCDIVEQQEIVRRIEAAFARIDRLAEEARRATALLDRLEQATLAKAFRGELLAAEPAAPVVEAVG